MLGNLIWCLKVRSVSVDKEGGVESCEKILKNMTYFIFGSGPFIKDFYVAFTAWVHFFFQIASKESKTSRCEAACQGYSN